MRNITTLAICLLFSPFVFSQDCDSKLDKAVALAQKMEQTESAEDYYNYGQYLCDQIIARDRCIDRNILYQFKAAFAEAADLGHTKAGTRLALTSLYGLYSTPINYKNAFETAKSVMQTSIEKGEEDFMAYGWMNATIFLDRATRNGYNPDDKQLKSIWKRMQKIDPKLSADAPSSEKRALRLLNEVRYNAYTYGKYGVKPNAEKALQSAEKNSLDIMYRNMVHLRQENVKIKKAPTKAQELAMSLYYLNKGYFHRDAKDYAVARLNALGPDFTEFSVFQKGTQQSNGPWNSRIEQMVAEEFEGSLQKMHEALNGHQYLEDLEGYKGWNSLSAQEKNALFSEAIDKDGSMNNKERFSIFKAMYKAGDPQSHYWLGQSYQYQKGVYRNITKAIELYENSINAQLNVNESSANLAKIYDSEEGFQDWNKALPLLAHCYENNFDMARMTDYAEYLYIGLGGIDRDTETATEIFRYTAEEGNKRAGGNLKVIEALNDYEPIKVNEKGVLLLELQSPYQHLFNLKEEEISFDYNIEVGTATTVPLEVQLYVYKSKKSPALHYNNFSPTSALIKGKGSYRAIVYPYNKGKGKRDFGFLAVGVNALGKDSALHDIPVIYYHVPE